ncbi:MAG: hypothetical protein NG737_00010 [Omnitrophica bacterium]|nr:hypothetical protein [Candidatus Omnitrophota bacterium]
MKEILRYKNVLVGIAIVLVFWMAFRNILSKHSLAKNALETKREEFEEGKKVIKKWVRLVKDYKELERGFLQKNVLSFKKFVEEQAQLSGIDISSLSVSHKDKGRYWQVAMHIKAVSSYKQFVNFLRAVEKKKVEVVQIKIFDRHDGISMDMKLRGAVLK